MAQSGSNSDLAQAVTSQYHRQRLLAEREKGARFPPYSRAELEQHLASAEQRTSLSPADTAFIVDPHGRQPCVTAVEHLHRVGLTSLCVNIHNKGRFVLARQTGRLAFGYTTLTTGLEDENGNVCLLTVDAYNFPGDDALPLHSIIAVKEPFFTFALGRECREDEEARGHILVQNLSDLVFLCPTDMRVPLGFRSVILDYNKHALKCKEVGNKALKNGELARALACYTEGISVSREIDLTRDITRNRALVKLKLGRFDAAQDDARASFTHGLDPKSLDLDGKAWHRLGLSAYHLGLFGAAEALFKAQMLRTPNDESAKHELARTAARQIEQSGVYDFEKIIAGLSPSKPRVDAGNFHQRVEARESPGRGRGLYAKQNLAFGDLILCQKASFVVYENDPGSHSNLKIEPHRGHAVKVKTGAAHRVLTKLLLDNPSLINTFRGLYAGEFCKETPDDDLVDDMPVISSSWANEILRYNAFFCSVFREPNSQAFPFSETSSGDRIAGIGIWSIASLANHSCIANASDYFIGDLIVMRATKDIAAGDEITISYTSTHLRDKMQAKIKDVWEFACSCPLCQAEIQTTQLDKQKRDQLIAEFKLLMQKGAAAIQDVTKLARKMGKLYGGSAWPKGLPRRDMLLIYAWLFRAHALQGNHIGAANSMTDWLRCCGVEVQLGADSVTIDKSLSMSSRDIVDAFITISRHKKMAGQHKIAAEFDRLAKESYLVYNGTMHGFEQVVPVG